MKPKKKSNVITIDANQAVKHPMQCAKCFRVCRLSDSGKTWVCTICKHREKANGGQAVSETPRTDAVWELFATDTTLEPDVEFSTLARQLERELTAANTEIEEKRKDVVWLATEKAKLENYVTELENRLRALWDKYDGDRKHYMDRIKRLEEAGDNMAEWLEDMRNLGADACLSHAWREAKEDKL